VPPKAAERAGLAVSLVGGVPAAAAATAAAHVLLVAAIIVMCSRLVGLRSIETVGMAAQLNVAWIRAQKGYARH